MKGKNKIDLPLLVIYGLVALVVLINFAMQLKGDIYWCLYMGTMNIMLPIGVSIAMIITSIYGIIWICKRNERIAASEHQQEEKAISTKFVIACVLLVIVLIVLLCNYRMVNLRGKNYLRRTVVTAQINKLPVADISDLDEYGEIAVFTSTARKRRAGYFTDSKDLMAVRTSYFDETGSLERTGKGKAYFELIAEYYECRNEKIAEKCVESWKQSSVLPEYEQIMSDDIEQMNLDVSEMELYRGNIEFVAREVEQTVLLVRDKNKVAIYKLNNIGSDSTLDEIIEVDEWVPIFINSLSE